MNWGPKRSSDSFKATQPAQDLDAGHLPSNPVFLPRDQHCLVPGVVGYKEAQNFLCAVQQVTSESWVKAGALTDCMDGVFPQVWV